MISVVHTSGTLIGLSPTFGRRSAGIAQHRSLAGFPQLPNLLKCAMPHAFACQVVWCCSLGSGVSLLDPVVKSVEHGSDMLGALNSSPFNPGP